MAFSVGYIVDDVDEAIGFNREKLGFEVDSAPGTRFRRPQPGRAAAVSESTGCRERWDCWWQRQNRAVGTDSNSPSTTSIGPLRSFVIPAPISGRPRREAAGGRQILMEDTSGNPVELFEPTTAG